VRQGRAGFDDVGVCFFLGGGVLISEDEVCTVEGRWLDIHRGVMDSVLGGREMRSIWILLVESVEGILADRGIPGYQKSYSCSDNSRVRTRDSIGIKRVSPEILM